MTKYDYFGLIKRAGIKENMTVDIVVDLFNVLKKCRKENVSFDPNEFIDALKTVVGPNGNILVRTFSWDWCHGKGFNIDTTSSQVGALGNVALKRSDFKRTSHPIYNWMVWGKDSEYLCNLDYKESFDENSVFAWEEKNDSAYQIDIGNPQAVGLTIFHYVEKEVGVDYRYVKDFTDIYFGRFGKCERTYSMYVRDLAYKIDTDFSKYEDMMLDKKILERTEFDGIDISSFKLKELCEMFVEDIKNNIVPTGVTVEPLSE